MWAQLMKEMGATDPKAMMLRFHAQTGGSTLTAQQPLNNIARVTVQTLAAVLGGTQSLHTNGYDEALSLPTEQAAAIALRTQQIIAFESGVADTADPLAGSYFVESLTDSIEQEAWKLMQTIDSMGGSVAAIENGFMQEEIAQSAYIFQQQLEQGKKIIVGVNKFQTNEKSNTPLFRVDDSIRLAQIEKLKQLRQHRDQKTCLSTLSSLRQQAVDGTNIMPSVVAAIEAKCTLGEIADTLREVFGEYRQ
jgi:methylmalonyl-CoA mutase N-terminal domain/subunit